MSAISGGASAATPAAHGTGDGAAVRPAAVPGAAPSLGASPDAAVIALRLASVSQLFQTLDPMPFRARALDGAAVDYILDRARELPPDRPVEFVVHLPRADPAELGEAELGEAVRAYFADRARATRGELRELLRSGRAPLATGIAALGVSLGGWFLLGGGERASGVARLVQESLMVFGWVAMWRPTEIYLHDWQPILRRRKLYARLARARVTLRRAAA